MGRGRRKSESLPKGEAAEATATVKAADGGVGAFGLQEAPVFHPTEAEFGNPLQYIAQIRAEAEPYGICRIVPPATWNPPFGLDTVKFAFPTKLQAIHHLQERPAACDADTFKLEYTRFLRKTGGKPVERWPCLDGEELDLCKLFNAVKRHGGLERVTLEDKWGEVWRMVTAGAGSTSSAATSTWATLRQLYEKHLCTFEAYQTKVASGKRWRAKRKQETTTEKVTIKVTRGARKRQSDGGVNLAEGLAALAAGADDVKKSGGEPSSAETDLCELLRPLSSEVESRYHVRRVGRGRVSAAGDVAEASGEATASGSKKAADSAAAQVDLSGDALPASGDAEGRSPGLPQRKRRKTEEKSAIPEEGLGRTDQICEQCHSGAHEQLMLLCDRCDRGWHLYCLSPPLAAVPVGNWYCLECLGSERESFGFGQGQEYHFDSFRRMADRFKRKWLGGRAAGYADLEREFWRVVEGATAPVEVLYGSDLDTGVYGSGFPRPSDPIPSWATADAWEAGARNPWNVNNFPKLDGSMLRLVHDNIPGVMVPWLYIGMLFSSFCWHYEDHCFYSVNYLHCGEPKSWYSVPGSAAEDFEKVMQKSFPDLFQAQPDLLFQLVTMLKPTVLRESGVPVCMTVQEPRNFVITFPRSYHGGFNHGFNCAEAVNFAPSDWLPFGGFGVERYRLYHKAAVLSHDELLCVIAKNDPSCRTSPWLQQELSRVVSKERYQREYLWSLGMMKSSQMIPRQCQDHIGAEEDSECIICRYYLHLSAVVCECRPGKAVCLQHARQLCECGADRQSLLYRFTLAELDDLISNEHQSLEECKARDLPAADAPNKRRLRRGQSGNASLSPLVKKIKGRPYKHLEVADMWFSQARGAGRSHLRAPLLEDLLSQAEQFLWGGHEMDQVREMVQKLNAARKWVQEVAACSGAVERHGHGSSGKSRKVSLATVRKLVTVDPIPWVEPHLLALKAAYEHANGLEQRILEALSSSDLEIRNLQRLQEEASRSPFELSGLQQLCGSLSTAEAWSDRARRLLSGQKTDKLGNRNDGIDLAQLRALHTEGARLRVFVAEKEVLESALHNVTLWQEQAAQLLARSCTLQELEDALQGSESLMVHTEEVRLLEERLRNAKAWIQNVASLKLQMEQHANMTASVEVLESLLQEGRVLQVHGLEEMAVLEVQLRKATWIRKASQTLWDFSSVEFLRSLIVEATRLQLADEMLCRDMLVTISDACAWEEKAQQLLMRGGPLVAFTELASAAERIHAKLPHLDPVKQAITEAKSWLHRGQPFCQLGRNAPDGSTTVELALSTLQALVAESQMLSVVLDEQKLLRGLLAAADSWVGKAKKLKASVFVSEPSEIQQGCSLNRKAESFGEVTQKIRGGYSTAGSDASTRLQDDLLKLQAILSEGLKFGMKIPEIVELQDLCKATRWSLKALDLVKCSPSLKEVEAHLEKATGLSVAIREYALLKRMLNDAKAWLDAAIYFLPGFGEKGNYTEGQLEKLITDAQLLQISVGSQTECLEDTLASHRTWKRKVQEALEGTTYYTLSELRKLQEEGKANILHTEEEDLLKFEVSEADSWMSRCMELIALRPGYHDITLEDLFKKMRSSVELAMLHLDPHEKRVKLGLTCVCQGPVDESDDNLLHCEDCDDWYHPSCVAEAETQTPGRYKCPYCLATSSGSLVTQEDLRSKIHATQRPKLHLLKELQLSARMLRCRMKEKEHLEVVVELVQQWERRIQTLLEPALLCPDRPTAPSFQLFAAAQKAVEAIEVQTDGDLLLPKALAANSWRNRALKLLEESHKPLQRTVTRMMKEGLSMQIPTEDFAMNKLKEADARASLWAAQVKEAVCDHGRLPLADVEALIVEGEKLPVTVSKEVEALRERSVLYCICRKPYDEERAMIACDRCGEWYHFSCINLPEPDSSDEETDDAIQQECELSGDFFCPKCKESSLKGKTEGVDVETTMSYRDQVLEEVGGIGQGLEGHFSGLVRGKRSNRSYRARGELQQKWASPLFASGKLLWHTQRRRNSQEQPDGSVSASGRPCRRTAGRHSRFESFVLLMRSR